MRSASVWAGNALRKLSPEDVHETYGRNTIVDVFLRVIKRTCLK